MRINTYMIGLSLLLFTSMFSQSFLDYNQDTLYNKFNIDQILKYEADYQKRITRNIKKHDKIRKLGLQINREMLDVNSDAINQDFMIIRAAEYLNDKVDVDYGKLFDKFDLENEIYDSLLVLYEADSTSVEMPEEPEFPQRDYSQSIKLYDRIINEFPDGEMIDDALYLKAYLLREMGEVDRARDLFNELIDKFPDSKYTPHALMQYAEYFFSPQDGQNEDEVLEGLKRSIILYRRALKYTDSYRYDEALYRLGWASYKLAAIEPERYSDAIYYFIRVIDDIYKAKQLDPGQERSRHEISEEAIQYVGICFYYMDNDGYRPAIREIRKYVELLIKKKKPYADAILKSLGDVYYNIQSDEKTIAAYSMLQELFPYYKEGADIQYRIVEAYRGDDSKYNYRSDAKSFDERYKLFEKYNTKSRWYSGVQKLTLDNKFEILSKAEKNAERALAENITLLYQDALDKEQESIKLATQGKPVPTSLNISDNYIKLTKYCREYLEHFPLSKDAAQIHFSMAVVLDQKLRSWQDAYEEFIVISNSYPEAPSQLIIDAAVNAVIVADTLYAITGQKNRKFEFDLDKKNVAEELIPAEKQAIEAYENYIKISPKDDRAAKYIYNISGIYYNRKQFSLANRYNKTLLKQFPGTGNEGLAREQILNGYLAKKQFLSAEAMCRKIFVDKTSTKEQIDYAKMRLADAILLNAQAYEARGKNFVAGIEFRRVALDAPYEKRKDYLNRALAKSADNFQKEKEYEQAILSLELLVDQTEKLNPYKRNALINLANNYQDLKHFKYAAEIYEKVTIDYPDSLGTKDYLFNASVLYDEAKSWKDAIRTNNKFSARYPTDKNSKDMLFLNAGYYLKLDDFENANIIYDNFARKYPDDPRTIQAFYERGKYFLTKEDIKTAKLEFNKALNKHESFKSRKKKGNRFYAAESSFELIKLIEKDYESIEYKWPKRNIDRQLKTKKDLLVSLTDKYQKLISYGSMRSLEAPFRIAEAYENYAHTYSEQETNPNERNVARRIVDRQKIRNTAENLYYNAIKEYKTSFDRTLKISNKLISVVKASQDTIKNDNRVKRSSNVDLDSLQNLSQSYVDLAKLRVTDLVFKVAKQSEENVKNAIDFKTEYYGKIGQETKNFVARKVILEKSVKAQVEKSITAYRKNLTEAIELNVENKFTEESKRRIIFNNNILADEYKNLSNSALDLFDSYYKEFNDLISKPYGRKGRKYRKVYADLQIDVESFLNYSTEFITESLNSYKETILKAREDSISNDLTEFTELSILTGPLAFSNTLNVITDSMKSQYDRFSAVHEKMNNEDPDNLLILNYEDGKAAIEGFQLAIADNILSVLDEAFLISKDLNLPKTTAYNQVLKILITSDPEGYAADIPRDTMYITSDESWKVTNKEEEGWTSASFDDSSWKSPYIIENNLRFDAFDTLKVNAENMWYADGFKRKEVIDSNIVINLPDFDIDTVSNKKMYYTLDTLGQKIFSQVDVSGYPIGFVPEYKIDYVDEVIDTVEFVDVFFRKKVDIPGRLYAVEFFGTSDGSTIMYLNNTEVLAYLGYNYGELEVGNLDVFGGKFEIGENTITLQVSDENKPRYGTRFYLRLEILPKEFSTTGVAALDETVVFTEAEEKFVQQLIKSRISKPKIVKQDESAINTEIKKETNKSEEVLESTEE